MDIVFPLAVRREAIHNSQITFKKKRATLRRRFRLAINKARITRLWV
jgi:hypothetical protein